MPPANLTGCAGPKSSRSRRKKPRDSDPPSRGVRFQLELLVIFSRPSVQRFSPWRLVLGTSQDDDATERIAGTAEWDLRL